MFNLQCTAVRRPYYLSANSIDVSTCTFKYTVCIKLLSNTLCTTYYTLTSLKSWTQFLALDFSTASLSISKNSSKSSCTCRQHCTTKLTVLDPQIWQQLANIMYFYICQFFVLFVGPHILAFVSNFGR